MASEDELAPQWPDVSRRSDDETWVKQLKQDFVYLLKGTIDLEREAIETQTTVR